MAFIPVNNTAQVAVRSELFGAEVVNTLSFNFSASITASALNDLGLNVIDWWTSNILPNLSADFVTREAYCVSLESVTAPSVVVPVVGGGAAGGDSSPSMPGPTCLAVSFRTNARGRSGRGRNYVSGLGENKVTGNQVTSSLVEALRVGYASLISDSQGWETPWVVVQRFSNGAALPAGIVRFVTAVVVVDPIVDSQRGRKR